MKNLTFFFWQICAKFHHGWQFTKNDWHRLIEICVRYCVDVPGSTVFMQNRSDIEAEILQCVDFVLIPFQRDESGPLHRTDEPDVWEYFEPSRFLMGAPAPDPVAEVTVVPYRTFSVIISCERGRQIQHHWTLWKHVDQLEISTRVFDREFLVKFSGEIECPHLRAVHCRMSALVGEDYVMAMIVYRFCWGKYMTVTGILPKDRLERLTEAKTVLNEVRIALVFLRVRA